MNTHSELVNSNLILQSGPPNSDDHLEILFMNAPADAADPKALYSPGASPEFKQDVPMMALPAAGMKDKWICMREGDSWPQDVKLVGPDADGRVADQFVGLFFILGEPVMGSVHNNGGKVSCNGLS